MHRKKWIWIVPAVFFAAILVLGGGFAYLYWNGMSGLRENTSPLPGQIKVACVGDSITYGHGVSNWPENQYPVVLGRLLGENYHTANFGVSGCTAQADADQPYGKTDTCQSSLDYHGDILIFMLGSNDSKPENWQGREAFETQYLHLLDRYLTESGTTAVYLCTPATAFYRNGESTGPAEFDIQPDVVEEISQIVEQIAQERGYTLVDIHGLTGKHPEWFAKDGIHPDAQCAAAIAAELCRVITQQPDGISGSGE